MQEPEVSPQDSIQLIESMINKAQNRFYENGYLYLLWGLVIVVCSVTSFISIYFFENEKNLMFIWMLTWLATIYQMIYLSRVKKSKTVKTYADEINNYVWVVFVVMGFLVGVIIGKSGYVELFNPLILML